MLPKRRIALSNTDFFGSDKVFKYITEENKDFTLSVKATDSDRGADGFISYRIERINSDDTFEIESSFNESTQNLGKSFRS